MHMKHAKNESKCWRYKNYIVSSFVRDKILFIFCWNSARFLRGRQYFYTRTSFLFAPPFYSFYLFQKYIKTQENPPTWNKLIRFLLRKLHYTSFSFRYIFASYHLLFSILSGYGAMFMHLSRKSDSKKLFGILITWE